MPSYTFYPDADPETTSVDGRCAASTSLTDDFATLRARNGATQVSSGATATIGITATSTTDVYSTLSRGIAVFDTSSITDSDTVDSGTFSLQATSKGTGMSQEVAITIGVTASNTALAASDFQTNTSTTRFADTDISIASINTAGSYNDWTLNAAGVANINKSGVSKFSFRMSCDVNNVAPTWVSSAAPFVNFVTADAAGGTSTAPKLVVETTAAAGSTFTPKIIMM